MLQSKVKEHVWWLGMGCNHGCADELHLWLLPQGGILLFPAFSSHCSLALAQKALLILWCAGSGSSSGSKVTTKITRGTFSC